MQGEQESSKVFLDVLLEEEASIVAVGGVAEYTFWKLETKVK